MVEVSTNRIRAVVEARYQNLRSCEREQANAEAREWQESEKRYTLMRESERRAEWADCHRCQAWRIQATSAALIDYHQTRAAQLERGGAAWP